MMLYGVDCSIYSAGSAVWTPSVLAPYVWTRADIGVSIATGVSSWRDLSGNERNYTQALGAKQPSLDNNSPLNGRPALKFNGAPQYVTAGTGFNIRNQQSEFYFVCSYATAGAYYRVMSNINSDSVATHGFTIYMPWNDASVRAYGSGAVSTVIYPSVVDSAPVLVGHVIDPVGQSFCRYNNTITNFTYSALANNTDSHYLGTLNPIQDVGQAFSGWIAENIGVVGRLMSTSERGSLFAYFNARYVQAWA